MRIVSKQLSIETALPASAELSPHFLVLNIETTGISAERSRVVLIGCLSPGEDSWDLIQWFDESGEEEQQILSSFLLYVSRFDTVVTYGGDRFDLAFLNKRLQHIGLDPLPEMLRSLDLYKEIQPFKPFIGLPDYKQQTLEQALETGRTDTMEGAEVARLYGQYLQFRLPSAAQQILAHNEADLTGIACMLPLTAFRQLTDPHLTLRRAQANYYTDHDGEQKEELFLFFRLQDPLPLPAGGAADHCYLRIEGADGVLKVPIYTETLRYFYANYKDYYFLPEEDMAVHKYIASYVDRSRRLQARPETCYTRKTASYLPEWDLFRTPFFKRAYTDTDLFFELTSELKRDREELSAYASYVAAHILKA